MALVTTHHPRLKVVPCSVELNPDQKHEHLTCYSFQYVSASERIPFRQYASLHYATSYSKQKIVLDGV